MASRRKEFRRKAFKLFWLALVLIGIAVILSGAAGWPPETRRIIHSARDRMQSNLTLVHFQWPIRIVRPAPSMNEERIHVGREVVPGEARFIAERDSLSSVVARLERQLVLARGQRPAEPQPSSRLAAPRSDHRRPARPIAHPARRQTRRP